MTKTWDEPFYQLGIFDNDGVLIPVQGYYEHIYTQKLFKDYELAVSTLDRLQHFSGRDVRNNVPYIEKYALERDVILPPDFAETIRAYAREYYPNFLKKNSSPVTGKAELLTDLRARNVCATLAIASNARDVEEVVKKLARISLSAHFEIANIRAANDERAKPSPHMLVELIQQHKADPERCFMIGDSAVDMVASNEAVRSVLGESIGLRIADISDYPGASKDLAQELWPIFKDAGATHICWNKEEIDRTIENHALQNQHLMQPQHAVLRTLAAE